MENRRLEKRINKGLVTKYSYINFDVLNWEWDDWVGLVGVTIGDGIWSGSMVRSERVSKSAQKGDLA